MLCIIACMVMSDNNNLLRADCRRFSAACSGAAARRQQRGFIHVLLLIFTVLGISLWGITEMLHRSQESAQESEQKHSERISRARRALLDYAVLAPDRVLVENQAGRYNAFAGPNTTARPDLSVPHRFFTMPCPDTASVAGGVFAGDENWDGASDILRTAPDIGVQGCGGSNDAHPVAVAGSRIGRLPWRTHSGSIGGGYLYERGLGEDLVDRHGDRFWYAVAHNLVRLDRAVNPHWLLRQTQGWIALAEHGTLPDGDFKQRVAGVVVSPGILGGNTPSGRRAPETEGTRAAAVDAELLAGYLDVGDSSNCNYGFWRAVNVGFGGACPDLPVFAGAPQIGEVIYYNNPPEARSDDRLAYITAEELASVEGEGMQLLLRNRGNPLDIAAGEAGFLGIKEIMRAHYDRYGALPPPAAFSRRTGEEPVRPSGVPGVVHEGRTVQSARAGVAGITITAILPVKNIRRVYLQPGARLAAKDGNFYGDGLPPYNLALYAMDTAFNHAPMDISMRAVLRDQNIYPRDNLLGFAQDISRIVTDSDAVRTIGDTEVPLDSRVYMKEAPPQRDIEFTGVQSIASGISVSMALAEPALAYLQVDNLTTAVEFIGGNNSAAAASPPYGMQVQLPAGTRFQITGDPLNPVSLFLRGGIPGPPAEYDIISREWRLTRQWPEPVLLADDSNRVITVEAVLHGLPVQAGDIGFFPVDDTAVEYFNTTLAYLVSPPAGAALFPLPGTRERVGVGAEAGAAASGSGVLRARNPISVLPEDLRLFTNAQLVVAPFPPPGRPQAGRGISAPYPLYVNYLGRVDGAGVGYRNQISVEFTLPAKSRIYYPLGVEFIFGVDFAFPEGAKAFLPPGTVMTLDVLPGATLPDGRRAEFPETTDIVNTVPIIAARRMAVTLVHGGMMDLFGIVGDSVAALVGQGARVVLRDGVGVGSSQELFDIEVHAPGGAGFQGIIGAVASEIKPFGGILQPLAGRGLFRSIEPRNIIPGGGATLRLSTWTRVQFLSRPQNAAYFSEAFRAVTTLRANPVDSHSLGNNVIARITSGLLVSNNILSGAEEFEVILNTRVGELGGIGGDALLTVQLTISEQTQFMLAPGAHPYFRTSSNLPSDLGGSRVFAHEEIIFAAGTGFYDPNIPSLDRFAIGGVRGWPVLAAALTVDLVDVLPGRSFIASRPVMFLDSETNVLNAQVAGATITTTLPAGSALDMLYGYSYPQGSMPVRQVADGEVGAVSGGEIYMYFAEAVTLTNRGYYDVTGPYEGRAAVDALEVDYTPPADIRIDYAAASFNNTVVDPSVRLSSYTEDSVDLTDRSLVLPAGSFLILPRGSTLDFLSPGKSKAAGAPPDEVEFAPLPENTAAVLPTGVTLNIGGVSHSTDSGLGYYRFGSGGRLALVNHASLMRTSPVIYYSEDAYLVDLAGLRGNIGTRILAGSQGDLFGGVHSRYNPDYEVNTLPSDTAEFLRNFPMAYAVAPNCRADIGGGGKDCADGENGLEFTVQMDERVVLEHELIPEGNIYITLVSELADNLQMSIAIRTLENFYTDGTVVVEGVAGQMITRGEDGRVGFLQTEPFLEGRPPADRFIREGVVEVAIPDTTTVSVALPSDAILRVYMNLPSPRFDAITPALLATAHYAEVRAITVYAGGYVQGSDIADAAARLEITAMVTATVTTTAGGEHELTNMEVGYGAQIGGDLSDASVFGRGGFFDMGGWRLPLDRYRLLRTFDFRMGFESESRHAEVDFAGNILSEINTGDNVVIEDGNAQAFRTNLGRVAEPLMITLDTAGSIPMAPGYLWQGYITPVHDIDNTSLRVTMVFSENAELAAAGFRNQAFLRVHPRDDRLNFWGSGNERAEGLDGRSVGRRVSVNNRSPSSADDDRFRQIKGLSVTYRNRGLTGTAAVVAIIEPVSPFLVEQYDLTGFFTPIVVRTFDDFENVLPGGAITRLDRGIGHGFRSEVTGDSTDNVSNGNEFLVRVRNLDGEIVSAATTVRWRPNYSPIQLDSSGEPGIPTGQEFVRPGTGGWMSWGVSGAPFYFPDQFYVSEDEIWLGRDRTATNTDGSASNLFCSADRFENNQGGSDRINNVVGTINGEAIGQGIFDPPQWQMRGTRLGRIAAIDYADSANIHAVTARGRDCPGDDSLGAAPRRTPGLILGHYFDVERHTGGSGAGCADADARLPSFSSRPRRNAGLDVYNPPAGRVPSPTVEFSDVRGLYFSRGAVPTDLRIGDNVNCPLIPSNVERFERVGELDLFLVCYGRPDRLIVPNGLQASLEFIPVADGGLHRRTRSATLPETEVLPFFGPTLTVEVRGVQGNAPNDFNRIGGGGAPTIAAANPFSYVVATSHGDYGRFDRAVDISNPEAAPQNQMTRTIDTDIEVPLFGDMMFYIDTAYREQGFGGVPAQSVPLGGDFRISGPGALVPHFGGHNLGAVADVYAARSRMMYALFANDPDGVPDGVNDDEMLKLHNVYSASTGGGSCESSVHASPRDVVCPAMYNPDNVPFWVPMISGIMSFEGVNVSFASDDAGFDDFDVFMVMPQPQAEVMDAGGNTVTIYGGSIIHPRRGLVRRALPITENSRLVLLGEAVAAVDVSPVSAPTPVRLLRQDTAMHGWDFNFAPFKAVVGRNAGGPGTDRGGTTLIMEPLAFEKDDIIEFSGQVAGGWTSTTNNPDAHACRRRRGDVEFVGPGNLYTEGCRRVANSNTHIEVRLENTVDITTHYDGTSARGFLMNDRMSGIMVDYYNTEPVFVPGNLFTTYFPYRDYLDTTTPLRRPALLHPDKYPDGNQVAPLGNPFSWHWVHRSTVGSFIPLGGARQFYYSQDALHPEVPAYLLNSDGCRGQNYMGIGGMYPAVPNAYDSPLFASIPCAGPDSHYWVGLIAGHEPPPANAPEEDADEFIALRLPHAINLPDLSIMSIPAHGGGNIPSYPGALTSFFEFPRGSIANILQVDSASWESVHPYAARYLPGAIFANDGGAYPVRLDPGDSLRDNTVNTRALLRSAEEMRVSEDNDGVRRLDISGRRVLHYTSTESAPGSYHRSNAPVYTNVWIKLLRGGYLINDANEIINLPANTIVNPILGTYLPGEPAKPIVRDIRSNYQAQVETQRSDMARAEIVRPAIVLPVGTTVRVGGSGARITNVKAAAIFSLSPLDSIECAVGGISGGNILTGGLPSAVAVSQSREGVSETNFADSPDNNGVLFTTGHPCAWLDDPENTDGDRFFMYRSRRRYLEPYKARILSNDRTYLLGGRLQLS